MEEEKFKITLNFNHIKKEIEFPYDDFDQLSDDFFENFKDFGADTNKKYNFKFEDWQGQKRIIEGDDDLCPSNFEVKKEIFIEEKEEVKEIIIKKEESSDEERNKSDSENSNKDSKSKSPEKSKEDNDKEKVSDEEENIEKREIKEEEKLKEKEKEEEEKEEEEVMDEKDIEKEINQLISSNKNNIKYNKDKENHNSILQNELSKLELELKSIKVNKKKNKKIVFEEELKKIQNNHEIKTKEYEEEIRNLNKINKELQDKLNELQLASNYSMSFKKNKTNKKNKKEEMLSYINKITKKHKKEKEHKIKENNFEKLINDEEIQRKKFIEQSKIRLKKLKEDNNNILIKKNINDKNDEIKENEDLKLKKESYNQKLKNLEKEKIKIEEEYKSKITILKIELEEKKKTKIEMANKKKEEEKRKRELEEKRRKEIEEKEKRELKLKLEEEKRQKELEKINNLGVKNSFNLLDDNHPNNYLDDINNKKEKIKEEPKEEPELDPLEQDNIKIKRKRTTAQTMAKMAYSYDCLNMINLQQVIYLGTDKVEFTIIIKNNGKFNWPSNRTKLVFDKNSKIKGKNVELKALASNEEQKCNVIIEGLAKLGEGVYDAQVWFNANGENCGKMLVFRVEIIKKEEDPIKEHKKEIEDFRNEYNLWENEGYSDRYLYEQLSENNFNFEETFLKIIEMK